MNVLICGGVFMVKQQPNRKGQAADAVRSGSVMAGASLLLALPAALLIREGGAAGNVNAAYCTCMRRSCGAIVPSVYTSGSEGEGMRISRFPRWPRRSFCFLSAPAFR